jgi:heterodisulfide reductase subunit A
VDFDQSEDEVRMNVASVIIASGADVFDPSVIHEYGYGVLPNVVTSLEFERLLSASGPTQGKVLRPSDGKEPRNIAFVQCVGSRSTVYGGEYCSSVCCMYALKEAIVAKEHNESTDIQIFSIDFRAFGKQFEEYRIRAEEEHGISIWRGNRVSSLEPTLDGDGVVVVYIDGDEIEQKEFDLVVLSVGMRPPEEAEELSRIAGVELNEYGFYKTTPNRSFQTTRPGVFAVGTISEPKDIPDTVCQSSAAALIAPVYEEGEVADEEAREEALVKGEEPRIGVFVCHCGINIGGVVDVPSVVEHVKTLPNVVHAEDNLYTCSVTTQEQIKESIKEHGLNRVVVASCSPRSYEKLFQETIREAGLNPYLFEMANIREHCSWVHSKEPERATGKARGLVTSAVAKARLLEPLSKVSVPVTKTALVIGGGLSGITAALSLAKHGIETHLVEKTKELGGNMKRVAHTLDGEDPQELLKGMIREVEDSDDITLHMETEVESVDGFVGNFHTKLTNGNEFDHGVVIVATGAVEYQPKEYLYGKNDRVMTQLELEGRMPKKNFKPKSVVMIQCVGSRVSEHQNCSRICCSTSVKNALWMKEKHPDTDVYVLYKDIRTYGFKERFYREASNKGVVFIRYDDENPPEVTEKKGKLRVVVKDETLGEDVFLEPECLVLSAGIRPNPDNENLSETLKVPISGDGSFLEAHMKLRPLEFSTDGVYLCGFAHSAKPSEESIAQSRGVAAKVLGLLSKDRIEVEPLIAFVNESRCRWCGRCSDVCVFGAIDIVESDGVRYARINDVLCKGCGACVVACPTGAMDVHGFTSGQLDGIIECLEWD